MDYAQMLKDLKNTWLRGTTCYPNYTTVKWVHDCGRYVLMQHKGHTEYVSRNTVSRCRTYFCLYDLADLPQLDIFGNPCLAKWEGRWYPKYDKEVNKIIANRLSEDVNKSLTNFEKKVEKHS